MQSPLAGFYLVPHETDPNKCSVTMVIEADLKGFIPGYVQKVAINDSANGVHAIRALMANYLKKYQDHVDEPVIY